MIRTFTNALILVFSCVVSVHAQHTAFDSFVSRVAKQYKVDIALSPELIPTVDSILGSGSSVTSIDDLLQLLVQDEHLTYQILDGNKLMLRRDEIPPSFEGVASIEGTIMDQAQGVPLPYAAVHIVNTTSGCQTDENGYFNLHVADTTSWVEIDYLGYKPVKKPITDFMHGAVTIKMKLHEIPLEEVTIVIPYKDVYQDPETQSLNLSQYELISENQLLQWNVDRLINTLTSYTQFSSDEGIRIRGVEAGNSLFLMDGLPVYDPYHFYNIFSPFNPNYFSSIKLYKNNLPVEYGGKIDGMIQLESHQRNPKNHLLLDSDLLLSSIETRQAIGKDFSFSAAARISHTGILSEDLRDSSVTNFTSPGRYKNDNEWTSIQQPTFNFYDINAGLEGKPGTKGRVYLNGFTSKDQLKTVATSDLSTTFLNQDIKNIHQDFTSKDEWKNLGFSTGFETPLSQKTSFHFDAFLSGFEKQESYTSYSDEEFYNMHIKRHNTGLQQSQLTHSGAKGVWKKEVSNRSAYQLGLDLNIYKVDLQAKENGYPYVSQTQHEFETTLFGDYEKWWSRHFLIVLGSRFTHLNEPSTLYILPNIKASYFAGHHFNFRSAFSQSVQAVHELTIENRFGRELEALILNEDNLGFPVLRSDKYMLGAGYTSTHFNLDAEFFYKKLDGLMRIASLKPNPGSDDATLYDLFLGDGWTAGMGLTAFYKKGNADIMVSYTLSKIVEQYDQLYNGDEFSPQEDRRHQLKVSGKYKLGPVELSTFMTYKSEAPYLSLVQLEGYDDDHGHHGGHGDVAMADQNVVFDHLPPFFSLDFGVDYSFPLFHQQAQVGISLINATDHANIEELQHIGRVSRENMGGLYITQQTELLGRTWNAHFKILF